MSTSYWIVIGVLAIFLGVFIYFDTKEGFHRALYRFLRLLLPLILAGIIVFLVSLISADRMIRGLLGLILSVIFFVVLSASLRLPEKRAQADVVSVFLGGLVGVIRAWLVIGFVLYYLRFFRFFDVSTVIGSSFYGALVKPIEWILFFTFLK